MNHTNSGAEEISKMKNALECIGRRADYMEEN